ncbi:hypothetical protein QTP88_020493 [Uroleucon formosanum]
MSNQSPSKSDVTNCSVTDDNNLIDFKQIKTFEWTTKLEKCLLLNMTRLKPCGINKHLSVLLLKEKISKELKLNIPISILWNYLSDKWDIRAADIIEHISFNTSEKDFALPEEFDQLIIEEGEKIKKLDKEYSKEGLNETIPSTLLESSPAKTNDVGFDDGPCTRRSLRTNEKLENSKSDEKNKLKDLKQTNKKTSNQSKDVDKIEKTSNYRGRKRKSRNVSESSLSSDNSKQRRNYKNNLTDLTVSESSSRSVTPEILRGKTSNRSVTPETISRKSNLRSSDKDQKSKLALEKACLKFGHHVDLVLPEIKIERLKPEKQYASLMDSKSKNLTHSKNEANNKVKAKIRNRVTSDLLVVQQSPEIQSLGRRSCSNKNS